MSRTVPVDASTYTMLLNTFITHTSYDWTARRSRVFEDRYLYVWRCFGYLAIYVNKDHSAWIKLPGKRARWVAHPTLDHVTECEVAWNAYKHDRGSPFGDIVTRAHRHAHRVRVRVTDDKAAARDLLDPVRWKGALPTPEKGFFSFTLGSYLGTPLPTVPPVKTRPHWATPDADLMMAAMRELYPKRVVVPDTATELALLDTALRRRSIKACHEAIAAGALRYRP